MIWITDMMWSSWADCESRSATGRACPQRLLPHVGSSLVRRWFSSLLLWWGRKYGKLSNSINSWRSCWLARWPSRSLLHCLMVSTSVRRTEQHWLVWKVVHRSHGWWVQAVQVTNLQPPSECPHFISALEAATRVAIDTVWEIEIAPGHQTWPCAAAADASSRFCDQGATFYFLTRLYRDELHVTCPIESVILESCFSMFLS